MRIEDDLAAAAEPGLRPSVRLGLHVDGAESVSDIGLTFNHTPLSGLTLASESGEGPDFFDQHGKTLAVPCRGKWALCNVPLEKVEKGLNQVGISASANVDLTLNDLRVWVRYGGGPK